MSSGRKSHSGLLLLLTLLMNLLSTFTHAEPQIAPVEDLLNVPLAPVELSFRLNDDGSPHIGRGMAGHDHLTSHDASRVTHQHQKRIGSGQPYWYSQIKRQGTIAYGRNSSYVLWRNVKDYGAKGDGRTDDTDAINNATAAGNRCGYFTGGYPGGTTNYGGYYGCDSQTTTPAIIYFPPGTYIVSRPIIMYYYTQVVGDANDLPILKATSNFFGIGILDADPYVIYQIQWYQNQNNFWRHVRNLVLDVTAVPASTIAHCIHWQVGQATSLQNLVCNMAQSAPGEDNKHVGIFMDNGSAQLFEDIILNGGQYGFFAGNQQYNIRNLTFNGCQTGLFQNWNWMWSYKSLTFNDCGIGIDMSQGDDNPAVGALILGDSDFNNCDVGILSTFSSNSTPITAGTLILDNVNFQNTPAGVAYPNNTVILPGNQRIVSFVQGTAYTAYDAPKNYTNPTRQCYGPQTTYSRIQQQVAAPPKSPSLLDANGKFYERSKPQYEGMSVDNVKSILAFNYNGQVGCPNDGVTDATACVQAFFDSIATNQLAFVDHGAYVITDTVIVPNNIKINGEIWPLFMVTGSNFQDQFNPIPAFVVGQPGDVGTTEITEILFETIGPVPGAIMMQWNLACTAPTTCGMWDTHWRIGGSNGTELQNNNCKLNYMVNHGANPTCWAAFLLVHITTSAKNLILSNNWLWVADHELDLDGKDQLDIYNGRGMLIESQGPMWVYGSSSEHSQLYNYQIANAQNIYLSMMQTETPYMQTNPNSLSSFTPQSSWNDPTFSNCFVASCFKAIALRIYNSKYIFSYGAGLYSFFENYQSGCLTTVSCDQSRVFIDQSEGIYMYGLTSVAATYMLNIDNTLLAPQGENTNGFAETIALFEYP